MLWGPVLLSWDNPAHSFLLIHKEIHTKLHFTNRHPPREEIPVGTTNPRLIKAMTEINIHSNARSLKTVTWSGSLLSPQPLDLTFFLSLPVLTTGDLNQHRDAKHRSYADDPLLSANPNSPHVTTCSTPLRGYHKHLKHVRQILHPSPKPVFLRLATPAGSNSSSGSRSQNPANTLLSSFFQHEVSTDSVGCTHNLTTS